MSFPSTSPGYNQVPPPLRSSQPAADYDGFFRAVGEVIDLAQKEQSIPPEWKLKYVEEYPRSREGNGFDHSFDVITFKVVGAQPDPTTPRGLRRFDAHPSPNRARYHEVVEGWKENVVVQFEVLSKSNQTANQVAIWLHRVLMQYANAMRFFMARGVQTFRFVARLEDDVTKDFGQDLCRRRLRYSFTLSFLLPAISKDLETLHVEVSQLNASGAASPVDTYDWSIDDGLKPQG